MNDDFNNDLEHSELQEELYGGTADHTPYEQQDAFAPRKKRKRSRVAQFMGRQGFYAVLFLCVGIIGVSAYFALQPPSGQEHVMPNEQVQQDRYGSLEEQLAELRPSQSPSPQPTGTQQPGVSPQTGAQQSLRVSLLAPVEGEVLKVFSTDSLLYSKTLHQWMTHDGIDLAAAEGTDVLSAMAGTVESVREDGLLGFTVTLSHGEGHRTVYANLARTELVQPNDRVEKGQVIGKVGRTAKAESMDESHLHFSYSVNGKTQDPTPYLETIVKNNPASEK